MSVQSEITRIQNARNSIRNKEVSLGIGTATDNLTTLASNLVAVTDRGTPEASVKEGEAYTIQPGYYHGGTVTGIAGGGDYDLQAKSATPTKSQQVIAPDSGYYGMSTVTIAPIPDAYQDVSSVTATAADVLSPKVYVTSSGTVTAGTMTNNGSIEASLDATTKDAQGHYTNTEYTVPQGYHDGTGVVSINVEDKTATPTKATQTVVPDTGGVLGKVTVNPIPDKYGDASVATASAGDILSGKKAIGYSNGAAVTLTGTMANNGAVEPSGLDCGESYTIPAGYHNGSGVVTANSLASQTGVDSGKSAITAGSVLTGSQGWVNGTKITGTMANNGAISGTITGLGVVAGDTYYNIPAGYTSGGTVSLTSAIETALAAI